MPKKKRLFRVSQLAWVEVEATSYEEAELLAAQAWPGGWTWDTVDVVETSVQLGGQSPDVGGQGAESVQPPP